MDFKDYTNILAAAGVIDWNTARRINEGINNLEESRAKQQQQIEDDFFEQAIRTWNLKIAQAVLSFCRWH